MEEESKIEENLIKRREKETAKRHLFLSATFIFMIYGVTIYVATEPLGKDFYIGVPLSYIISDTFFSFIMGSIGVIKAIKVLIKN